MSTDYPRDPGEPLRTPADNSNADSPDGNVPDSKITAAPETAAPVATDAAPPASTKSEKRGRGAGCFVGCLVVFILVVGVIAVVTLFTIFQAFSGGAKGLMSGGKSGMYLNIEEHLVEANGGTKKIVIINVHGIIYSGGNPNSSADALVKQLRRARDDDRVVAVILDMNTPGGEVTATDEVYQELLKLREDGIATVTCMRSIAASGGYYLAAGTDYIVANRLTITGSIGVIIGGYNLSGLFEKIGIKSELYKRGDLKDLLNMGKPKEDRSSVEIDVIEGLVEETYQEFVRIVTEGRGDKLDGKDTDKIFDSRIFSGAQAFEMGLVDELGFLENAIAKAKELGNASDARVVRYGRRPTVLEMMLTGKSSETDRMLSNVLPYDPNVKKGLLYYLYPLSQ